jgi:hypothetical protein
MSAPRQFVRRIGIYVCQAALFAVLSYGLLLLIYGRVGISFFMWALITLVAFTISYVPTLLRMVRSKRDESREK